MNVFTFVYIFDLLVCLSLSKPITTMANSVCIDLSVVVGGYIDLTMHRPLIDHTTPRAGYAGEQSNDNKNTMHYTINRLDLIQCDLFKNIANDILCVIENVQGGDTIHLKCDVLYNEISIDTLYNLQAVLENALIVFTICCGIICLLKIAYSCLSVYIHDRNIRYESELLPLVFNGRTYVPSQSFNVHCCICITDFAHDDIVTTTICNHVYHTECLNIAMLYSRKCPLCCRDLS